MLFTAALALITTYIKISVADKLRNGHCLSFQEDPPFFLVKEKSCHLVDAGILSQGPLHLDGASVGSGGRVGPLTLSPVSSRHAMV